MPSNADDFDYQHEYRALVAWLRRYLVNPGVYMESYAPPLAGWQKNVLTKICNAELKPSEALQMGS